ncbi:MAG: TM2 domain-containing protein [Bryobacterales bacterium]|nr:TM2 domain-containing protein [Bryobacterales bacterium]
MTIQAADLAPAPPSPSVAAHGAPEFTFGGYSSPALERTFQAPDYAALPKSRVTYILLGTFVGFLGVHNFYAGYKARAIAQLCITICTLFMGAIVSWIWAIIEVCSVDRDSRDIYMV